MPVRLAIPRWEEIGQGENIRRLAWGAHNRTLSVKCSYLPVLGLPLLAALLAQQGGGVLQVAGHGALRHFILPETGTLSVKC